MSDTASVDTRWPGFVHSLICFAAIVAAIAIGLFALTVDLHAIMFLCLLWTGLHCAWLGHDFAAIRELMSGAIGRALPAIYIFILIGMVIASFNQAGTIAALMYWSLGWLSANWFLPLCLILCALMSLATGTAWGTVGTLGVVLIGAGGAMGLPLPLVAGAIVGGATFGDKMSPISDTTNLTAMSAGANLYRHIHSMALTTGPSFVLALGIFGIAGLMYRQPLASGDSIESLRMALRAGYGLHPVPVLLPIVLLAVLSMRRVPAEAAMSASIVAAMAVAVLYQGEGATAVLNALWSNSPGATGNAQLDELLGRGGIASMSWTLLLALMALALGGILHGAGFLAALLAGMIRRVRRVCALVATTIGAGLLGNMAMGEAYISIILNCQLFQPKFRERKLEPAILSRSVEEGATMTTGLIPWTTAGAFYTATLGVAVIEYAPFAFFNYLNILVSVTMAALGIGLLRRGGKPLPSEAGA